MEIIGTIAIGIAACIIVAILAYNFGFKEGTIAANSEMDNED